MILLDYKDRRPLYEQIRDKFRDMILKEVMKEDEPMPSVRQLANELSINPNTIQRAYTELERDGWIYTVKGRGSFVSAVGNLKDARIKEWKNEFKGKIKEGMVLGCEKDELVEIIETTYRKSEEKSQTGKEIT